MKKWLLRLLAAIVLIALAAVAYGIYTMRSYGFLRSPVYETVAPELPSLERPAILVFSKTNSFIHKEAIPAAEQLFQAMAANNGWSIYITENGAIHNPEQLSQFDAIIWNNVTGDVLTVEQREAMRNYIESGGGWLGLHGAGDSSSDWDWYENTIIGAQFIGHPFNPQFQKATVVIEAQQDPIVAHLGTTWERTDEWYSFAESPRLQGKNILATLDESTYILRDHKGGDLSMGNDHPIIWKSCLGTGRTLYSAMGHTAESYQEPEYIELLEQAIIWTAGLTVNSCR